MKTGDLVKISSIHKVHGGKIAVIISINTKKWKNPINLSQPPEDLFSILMDGQVISCSSRWLDVIDETW